MRCHICNTENNLRSCKHYELKRWFYVTVKDSNNKLIEKAASLNYDKAIEIFEDFHNKYSHYRHISLHSS